MDQLNSDQLKFLHEALLSLEIDLENQLLINKDSADIITLDQTLLGRISRVDAIQQQEMAISTRQKMQLKLHKVKVALTALGRRNYGYCRKCEELIGFPRLKAQPETNLCIACQNRADRHR